MLEPYPSDKGEASRPHPRVLGWLGTTALAMGGSNQSLFLIGALIAGQGSAAVPLLVIGIVLSWAAAFGWTELVLMWPNRVGGIAATCGEAFRPYSPVLANLTGVCYWWGWVPTCGLTAILSATAISQWYVPGVPVPALATALVVLFTLVNLSGIRWVTRLAIPVASASAGLALLSGIVPVLAGKVDWHQATTFHLTTPFPGPFGNVTSLMAGLYLVGFAAPAFEAAACHVGETANPIRNVPRAMFASGAMACVYFVVLPIVWLGVLGPEALQRDLAVELGPTFAPLFGSGAKAAAVWFMTFNMFHGTLQPLAGASRTLMQLADDGLLPRLFSRRSKTDAPWVATLLTATASIAFLLLGDPTWLIAAANLAYLIGIGLPNVAVWLLRRDAPDLPRPYRAPRGTVGLGLLAAGVWGVATMLGFQQFGLPTVIIGLGLCYSSAALYALRKWGDRRRAGLPIVAGSLHVKLTGAMLVVLALDGVGYLIAVANVGASSTQPDLIAALEDIFVAVALLTISVGLVLPGLIAHAADEVAKAADRLATGTLADLGRAVQALSTNDLTPLPIRVDATPVVVHTNDELAAMAASFNTMQEEVARIAVALDVARGNLNAVQSDLTASHTKLEETAAALAIQYHEAEAERGKVRATLDAALDAMVVVSLDNLVLSVNRGFEEIFLIFEHQVRGRHFGDVLAMLRPSFADPAAFGFAIEVAVAGADDDASRVLAQKWPRHRDLELYSAPVHSRAGELIGRLHSFRDVTRERAVDRMKSEFVALVSHELRTPLTSIKGYVELLLAGEVGSIGDDQREFLDVVRRNADRLMLLINALLDLSRIEAGKIELQRTPLHLPSLVRQIAQSFRPQVESRGQTMRLELPPGLPEVLGDGERTMQILTNLVSNAHKYTPDGGHIVVSVEPVGADVRVEVRDTGIGMTPEEQERLFTRFYRAQNRTTQEVGGTGLGLAITKSLVELHGWRIKVASQPGQGSTFTVTIPALADRAAREHGANVAAIPPSPARLAAAS